MKDLPDLYLILQIDPSADPEVIDAVYRRLARKYHPDVNSSSDSNRKMQEINMAYEVLGNPERRLEYDKHRRPWTDHHHGTSKSRSRTARSVRPKKRWYRPDETPSRPNLVCFPGELEFGSLPKGTRQSASFKVEMTLGRKIRGRVMSNQSWIKVVSPRVLHDLSEATVEIVVDTAHLRDGVSHFGSISIESLAYGGLTVPVTAHVQEAPRPQLRVEPKFVQFEALEGEQPKVVRTIHIWDEAGLPMSGSLHVKPTWLKTDIMDFDDVPDMEVELTADVSNLRVGQSYSGRIEVHASNGRATVVVKVAVVPRIEPLPEVGGGGRWAEFLSQLEASTEWEQSFLQTVGLQARQRGWKPSNAQRTVLEGMWRKRMEKSF
jgi:curved DNA-binding protein CbpA